MCTLRGYYRLVIALIILFKGIVLRFAIAMRLSIVAVEFACFVQTKGTKQA